MRYRRVIGVLACTLAMLGPVAANAQQAPSESHLKAATDLLVLLDVEQHMLGDATAMADSMIAQNPMLEPYRSVLLEWAGRHLTWPGLQPRFAALYAEVYTEAELRELIAFYRTPTGRKAVAVGPDLQARGAMIGSEVAQEHVAELEQMIEARAAELEAASEASP